MTNREQVVAAVLVEHHWLGKPSSLCACGWSETSHVHGIHADHRHHVARAILAALDDRDDR